MFPCGFSLIYSYLNDFLKGGRADRGRYVHGGCFRMEDWSSLVAQWVKDPALPLQWLGFDP